MEFGTQIMPGSGVLFRLWAPDAGKVDLCLEDLNGSQQFFAMEKRDNGWFDCLNLQTVPGNLYRFRVNGGLLVPDPASRCQDDDVHGPSVVVDPESFDWQDDGWTGRPWHEAVIYELHVGCFSPEGSFSGIIERLDYLADLGVTAIELMPIADFPGRRNWGYDGVLLFAPDRVYGQPDDLKNLVQAAHARGLMVFLDVVYNHFGPEGNYLHVYGRNAFFTERHHTPWGAAINFDGPQSRTVRDFYIHNALYWLEEYHLDGLRFDAVHVIKDDSRPDILEDIAQAMQNGPGKERQVHLVLENDNNEPRYLGRSVNGSPKYYAAQWNDDLHHACHVMLTNERDGYYMDYADAPLHHLGRCLTEGFAYQGEPSLYRHGACRGGASKHLPPTAFVSFLQNHDQVGNRAMGERLIKLTADPILKLAVALFLLAPSPPLLFMGEEYGAETPFLFFCDFGPDLADKVANGRRRELARFPRFRDVEQRRNISDPGDPQSFSRSCLQWPAVEEPGNEWQHFYKGLLELRHTKIVPRLAGLTGANGHYRLLGRKALQVQWLLGDGAELSVLVQFGGEPLNNIRRPHRAILYADPAEDKTVWQDDTLPPRSIIWYLND